MLVFTHVPESFSWRSANCPPHLCQPVSWLRFHLHAAVAENIGVVAWKEAEVLLVLVLQGFELMAWHGRESDLRVHREAIHFLSHWDSILQDRGNDSLAVCRTDARTECNFSGSVLTVASC